MLKILIGIILAAILLSVYGGYTTFKSVFDMKGFKYHKPNPAHFDNERDLMRPTSRILNEYQQPYKDSFFDNDFEDLYVTSYDGLKLHGYFYRGTNDEVVICVHGYKSAPILDYADKLPFFQRRGSSVLMVDNRAHGKSEGRYLGMSELDKYDVKEWVNLINNMFDNPRIYLYGISMGGATVIHCADMNLKNVIGIIDDCGFNSILDITKYTIGTIYHLPYIPFGYIGWFFAKTIAGISFNASIGEECVKHTNIPILFIHGTEDHFVPFYMSKNMYEVCASKKEFLIVEGAGHAGCHAFKPKEYEDAVNRMLDGKI